MERGLHPQGGLFCVEKERRAWPNQGAGISLGPMPSPRWHYGLGDAVRMVGARFVGGRPTGTKTGPGVNVDTRCRSSLGSEVEISSKRYAPHPLLDARSIAVSIWSVVQIFEVLADGVRVHARRRIIIDGCALVGADESGCVTKELSPDWCGPTQLHGMARVDDFGRVRFDPSATWGPRFGVRTSIR